MVSSFVTCELKVTTYEQLSKESHIGRKQQNEPKRNLRKVDLPHLFAQSLDLSLL